jgi:hypothetical protein
MHLFPEFVCDFDSLIESDSESEEECKYQYKEPDDSDIEIDFDIAISSPIQQKYLEDEAEGDPEYSETPQGVQEYVSAGGGHLYAPCDAYQALKQDDEFWKDEIDIDIFDDADYGCGPDVEDDDCNTDVSSEFDILEADTDDVPMDIDTASSVVSSAEFRGT